MSAKGDYYPFGANMYVPNMQYAADMNGLDGKPFADLGILNASSATLILNAQSIAVAGSTGTFANEWNNAVADMGKFGRNLTYVASGASTSTVTVRGFDYLGQPMIEQITLNGATPVNGTKAFRRVQSITWTATGATTMNVGTGNVLGLPYAFVGDAVDYTDSVRSGTQGTFTVWVVPQSITSGDPRGTYAPHSSVLPNGARRHSLTFEPLRGNLYGAKHFYS